MLGVCSRNASLNIKTVRLKYFAMSSSKKKM